MNPRDALVRALSLDSQGGAMVIRSTPGFLADSIIVELNAMGFLIVPTRSYIGDAGPETVVSNDRLVAEDDAAVTHEVPA